MMFCSPYKDTCLHMKSPSFDLIRYARNGALSPRDYSGRVSAAGYWYVVTGPGCQ